MYFDRKNRKKTSFIIEDEDALFADTPPVAQDDICADNVKKAIGHSNDVQFRTLHINDNANLAVTIVFIHGMVNQEKISDFIVKPLLSSPNFAGLETMTEVVEHIEGGDVYYSGQKKANTMYELCQEVLTGSCALIIDELQTAYVYDTMGYETRPISESTAEIITKGSRDSFVEVLRTNTSMIRRRFKSQDLVIEHMIVGKQTLTPVAILYLKGITNEDLVQEMRDRINKIDTDSLIASAQIEEYITDNVHTPFPLVMYTELPEKVCSCIVEGRVALLVDGLPLGFIVPTTFKQFIQASDDYSSTYIASSFIRFLRFIMVLISLLLPAFYVALTTFHHEMIPIDLIMAIGQSKSGVAFPSIIETLLMLILFEVLLEAGKRLPKGLGQTIGVVGAIVVGQSAVQAKVVSSAVVVVMSIAAIASYVLPVQDFSRAIRLWRLILAILASFIGLFGMCIGFIILIAHLAHQKSFGVPYILQYDSKTPRRDDIFRPSMRTLNWRPRFLKTKNPRRQR